MLELKLKVLSILSALFINLAVRVPCVPPCFQLYNVTVCNHFYKFRFWSEKVGSRTELGLWRRRRGREQKRREEKAKNNNIKCEQGGEQPCVWLWEWTFYRLSAEKRDNRDPQRGKR